MTWLQKVWAWTKLLFAAGLSGAASGLTAYIAAPMNPDDPAILKRLGVIAGVGAVVGGVMYVLKNPFPTE